MLDFLRLFLHVLAAPFRTQAQLEAEVTLLRHQLNVLRRQAPSKPRLTAADRLLLVWLWRLFPSLRSTITIVQPDTVLRWHRSGFRLYWRWKSRSRSGRPRVPVEVRSLIRRLNMENPLWGAPRIHGELLKLGFEVAQSTVAKYMARRRPGSGQTWKTFLRNHASGIGAVDFLVVPTINFRLLFVLVILRHERRRLISLSVTDHPTAAWIARQITEAFPWDSAPCACQKLDPTILMMKSAKDRLSNKLAEPVDRPMVRRIFVQGQMCSAFVVIAGVGRKDQAQMALAEDDGMIEALPADRADQSLRMPILPG